MTFSERQAGAVEAWADYCRSTHRYHDEPCPRPVVFDAGFHMGHSAALRGERGKRPSLREQIKLAILTAQDQEGELLYAIPPGVAGIYADAILRALEVDPRA